MLFDDQLGFYQPDQRLASCARKCGVCESVCPFVPANPTTVDITRGLFGDVPGIEHDEVLGYYLSTRVGHSPEHREASASGGLVTWMLERLLTSGEVSRVICVGPDEHSPTLFSFRVCRTVDEIRACASSCYQPVDGSGVLRAVLENEETYAIVALPCVAKALRLAMRRNAKLSQRVRFVLGLACYQMKSRHFIDYLSRMQAEEPRPIRIEFRRKDVARTTTASPFGYRFYYRNQQGGLRGRDIGPVDDVMRVYCQRWFTTEACDYCDDHFAECADAVFMDAWLPKYSDDCRGHTIAAVRSMTLDEIMRKGFAASELVGGPIPASEVLQSQMACIVQKRIYSKCNEDAGCAKAHPPVRFAAVPTSVQRNYAFYLRNLRRVYSGRVTLATRLKANLVGKLFGILHRVRR